MNEIARELRYIRFHPQRDRSIVELQTQVKIARFHTRICALRFPSTPIVS